jgi:hypothetical protein
MNSTDIATDSLTFDGGLTVSLIQKRGGTQTTVTIRVATAGPLNREQRLALGSVGLAGGERYWSLNAADVGSAGVQPGDVIDDGTTRWTVIAASLATLNTRWRCATRQQN